MPYVDIEIKRMWRLIVTKPGVETEYLVSDMQLGPLITNITCDPAVKDMQCIPLRASAHDGVWMTSRAPRAA
jgi:hypothetical protein